MAAVNQGVILSRPFLEALLKRSTDVEDLLELCGRIKVQRAALAIVETYLEITEQTGPPHCPRCADRDAHLCLASRGGCNMDDLDRACLCACHVHPVDTREIKEAR